MILVVLEASTVGAPRTSTPRSEWPTRHPPCPPGFRIGPEEKGSHLRGHGLKTSPLQGFCTQKEPRLR